jgi:hypothetical protein
MSGPLFSENVVGPSPETGMDERLTAETHAACPQWLQGLARSEWEHHVRSGEFGTDDLEILAMYCLLGSLSRQIGEFSEILESNRAADIAAERERVLLASIADLDAPLTSALQAFAATLGIPREDTRRGRPTRILILEEEGPDTSG